MIAPSSKQTNRSLRRVIPRKACIPGDCFLRAVHRDVLIFRVGVSSTGKQKWEEKLIFFETRNRVIFCLDHATRCNVWLLISRHQPTQPTYERAWGRHSTWFIENHEQSHPLVNFGSLLGKFGGICFLPKFVFSFLTFVVCFF